MEPSKELNDENQKLDKNLLTSIAQKLLGANKVPKFEFEYEGKKYIADDLGNKIHFKAAKSTKFYAGFARYENKTITDVHFFEEPIHESDYSMVGYLSQILFENTDE